MEFLIAIVAAIALHLVASELYEKIAGFAELLIKFAVKRVPTKYRDRYAEEWLAHCRECTGHLSKVLHAMQCVVGARVLARDLQDIALPSPVMFEMNGKAVELDPATAIVVIRGVLKAKGVKSIKVKGPDSSQEDLQKLSQFVERLAKTPDANRQPNPAKIRAVAKLFEEHIERLSKEPSSPQKITANITFDEEVERTEDPRQ